MEDKNNEIIVPGFVAPVISVQQALQAYQIKKDLIDKILRGPSRENPNGVDYGAVPGTDKPTLKKAGAEKVISFFGLHPVMRDDEFVEDWTGKDHDNEPFIFYRRTCNLYRGETLLASMSGSCNSWEKKYRYRSGERKCPHCGKASIIKGKAEYGGGWLCFAKKGGCGAKFNDGDPAIEKQDIGQVKNADVAELANTILKMADKRAFVAATLVATGLSDYFTQDMEDFVDGQVSETKHSASPTSEEASAEPRNLCHPMSSECVKFAAKTWNISEPEAAKEIAKKKLGTRIEWDDFVAIVNCGPEATAE